MAVWIEVVVTSLVVAVSVSIIKIRVVWIVCIEAEIASLIVAVLVATFVASVAITALECLSLAFVG